VSAVLGFKLDEGTCRLVGEEWAEGALVVILMDVFDGGDGSELAGVNSVLSLAWGPGNDLQQVCAGSKDTMLFTFTKESGRLFVATTKRSNKYVSHGTYSTQGQLVRRTHRNDGFRDPSSRIPVRDL
jgi:hypothetical protein